MLSWVEHDKSFITSGPEYTMTGALILFYSNETSPLSPETAPGINHFHSELLESK